MGYCVSWLVYGANNPAHQPTNRLTTSQPTDLRPAKGRKEPYFILISLHLTVLMFGDIAEGGFDEGDYLK